jgi:chromosome segregation ATPase
MGLLTQKDVAEIQDKLKDSEVSMKERQDALEQNQEQLKENFDKLNEVGNRISAAQKTIDTEEANIKSYQNIIASNKSAIKDKDAAIDAAKAAGDEALAKQLEKEKDALKVNVENTENKLVDSQAKVADNKANMEDLQRSYDGTKTDISELQAEQADIKAGLDKYTKDFNEYSNSKVLAQFEEEKEARKQHVESTVRNKERLMPLLKNANTGLDSKMDEFTSDTNIFVEDIKTELGVDEIAAEIIKQSIAELNDEYQKKGTEGVFMASKALELSRKSLFDLELAGINKLIKAACYKGETSIELMESEITASQIIALNEGGYKITHEKNNKQYEQDKLSITIDWGFAAVAPN